MTSGIYLHIPFCQRKCDYCDFFSFKANDAYVHKYITALLEEIRFRTNTDLVFDTLYIGGGTPSSIAAEHISQLIAAIKDNYNIVADAEITIEVNPESVSEEKLHIYKKSGVNRISTGIQSFLQEELGFLGRFRQVDAQKVLSLLNQYFANISLDLIYGLTNQSFADFTKSLEQIPDFVKHVSCYSLSIEHGTKLFKQKIQAPDEEHLTSDICSFLENKDYGRYEISNYAKLGFESRHNLHYWNKDNYLGFGAEAVSTLSKTRVNNTTNMLNYLSDNFVASTETLSDKDLVNEAIMLGFRLIKGVNIADFNTKYGVSILQQYSQQFSKYKEYFSFSADSVCLNSKGLDLFNSIVSDFFV